MIPGIRRPVLARVSSGSACSLSALARRFAASRSARVLPSAGFDAPTRSDRPSLALRSWFRRSKPPPALSGNLAPRQPTCSALGSAVPDRVQLARAQLRPGAIGMTRQGSPPSQPTRRRVALSADFEQSESEPSGTASTRSPGSGASAAQHKPASSTSSDFIGALLQPHYLALSAIHSQLMTALLLAFAINLTSSFEGGNIRDFQQPEPGHFVISIPGETDQDGRNRQANWYYFRLDNVRGRALTLEITNLAGEYNYRPNKGAVTGDTPPFFSTDNRSWQPFTGFTYDPADSQAGPADYTGVRHSMGRAHSALHKRPSGETARRYPASSGFPGSRYRPNPRRPAHAAVDYH